MSTPDRVDGTAAFPWDGQLPLPPAEGAAIPEAIRAATNCLLRLQDTEGFWLGELEADSSLEADAILLDYFLGDPHPERVRKLANTLREEQLPEGGWSLYPGGRPNVNLTVKAYYAMRLAGLAKTDPALRKAEEMARQLGGIEATNSFTRIYLCLFGQYDWRDVPAIPPEIVLLPSFAYINIYEVSSWSRAILVPLSIIYAFQPVRKPPAGAHLRRWFRGTRSRPRGFVPPNAPLYSWKTLFHTAFHTADRTLSVLEQKKWTPLRGKALQTAEQWILDHLEGSDGLGAIYPAMMNCIMALNCLGYDREDPVFARQVAEFWKLAIEEKETIRMQPCFSPVWDTALAIFAAAESGLGPTQPALCRAAEWLISRQVLRPGDWKVKNPKGEPGGWAFEFANDPFPDVDDTAMVLLALSRVRLPDLARQQFSIRRGLEWLLSMQSSDGGWASFEVDVTKSILCHVPYADHNAMLDPSAADITGRVLEMLGTMGYDAQFPPVRSAIEFLQRQQEPDGSWYGRWGVNYLYGTCFALRGLAAVGVDMREGFCLRAAEWIRSYQNPDGGWGESCDSYDTPDLRGLGPSTASQTAWALLGLLATGDFDSDSVRRGIQFLLETQKPSGRWEEQDFTGTGFPSVFYLKYHLYSLYFPLLALSDYHSRRRPGAEGSRKGAELQLAPSC
ncbi:MAG: squalene--hopene cyclase [Acidobacteria bacterium RIFCSPLOWO2_02_FULL_61_28]|nr:MAG: squalene--hopene cyclase [Acidobacteria bacterium RIFCSPLOWO2_02_FULL_61_28]